MASWPRSVRVNSQDPGPCLHLAPSPSHQRVDALLDALGVDLEPRRDALERAVGAIGETVEQPCRAWVELRARLGPPTWCRAQPGSPVCARRSQSELDLFERRPRLVHPELLARVGVTHRLAQLDVGKKPRQREGHHRDGDGDEEHGLDGVHHARHDSGMHRRGQTG